MRLWKLPVFLAGLAPLLWLAWGIYRDDLGPNPVEYLTHATGDWALRFLLITLAITPLRRLASWRRPMLARRMLGLFSFFYACLHLLVWLWLDREWYWAGMLEDVLKRPYITVGMLAFAILLALALTSNVFSMRRLGKNWQRLHRLAYLAALLGVLHYWWLVKADVRDPLLYLAAFIILMVLRLPALRRR